MDDRCGLFLGGLIAAPIAAYIVRILPTRIMGTAVGGFILVINANTFFGAVGLSSSVSTVAFILIIAVWIAALAFAIGARRQDQEEAAAEDRPSRTPNSRKSMSGAGSRSVPPPRPRRGRTLSWGKDSSWRSTVPPGSQSVVTPVLLIGKKNLGRPSRLVPAVLWLVERKEPACSGQSFCL